MLDSVVKKVSGKTVQDYLIPRMFDKLHVSNPLWDTCQYMLNPILRLYLDSTSFSGAFLLRDVQPYSSNKEYEEGTKHNYKIQRF